MTQLFATIEDAVESLRLSRTTIYRLMADGTLPSVKVGRNRRIPVAALEAFVAESSA